MSYLDDGFPPWWEHLLSHIGLTPADIDTLDKDFDPFRGVYEKIKDTVDRVREHIDRAAGDSTTTKPSPDVKPPAEENMTGKKRPAPSKKPTPSVSKRIRFDSDDSDDDSLSNMPGRRIEPIFSRTRGGYAGDEEVDVVPPPKVRALTAPDYFTIDLPYVVTGHRTTAKQNVPIALFFKLNSIFDPQTSSGLGTEHQPMGRDLWTGVYQYYRVLSSTFSVTVMNYDSNSAVSGTSHPSFIFGLSPQETVTPTLQTREALMESKISKWTLVHPIESNHHSATLSMNYTPESWDFHVQESGIDERWTPIGSNPAIIHYVCFHIGNMFDGDVRNLNAQFTVNMRYTVQFREANSSYIHTIDTQ